MCVRGRGWGKAGVGGQEDPNKQERSLDKLLLLIGD